MDDVLSACRSAVARDGLVLALTGAGISAESGIPTFRGEEGYWTVGSRAYHPQELATHEAFEAMPWEVWAWYLYRRGVCRAATPNPAHVALARLDATLGARFALVTQNVDGLHRRAGHAPDRMFPIHGDLELFRCAVDCALAEEVAPGAPPPPHRWPLPADLPTLTRGARVPEDVRARLRCPRCGGLARPHVLWFDECYDEPRFHLDTVRRLAARATLLVVVGTSAQTNLPWQVVTIASRAGATIVDVNVADNPFGEIATRSGGVVRGTAAAALPAIADAMISR